MAGYSTGFDPYSQQAQEIERKQRYAELLRQQSAQPVRNMGRGRLDSHLSWTQGLAKAMQGYNAGAERRGAAEQSKALGEKYYGDLDKVFEDANLAQSGRPASELSEEDNDPTAAVAPNPSALPGIYSRHPATAGMAGPAMKQQMLLKALQNYGAPQQGAAPAGGPPLGEVGGMPTGAQGPGGLNVADPRLMALAAQSPGMANLISTREIANQKSGNDQAKLRQARDFWVGLSAAQRADLEQKGVKSLLDIAAAIDAGVINPGQIQAPTLPGAGAGAQQAPGGGQPMSRPVESPQQRQQAAAGSLGVLNGEQARGEIVDPAAAAREQARLTPMAGNAPVPAFQTGAPAAAPAPGPTFQTGTSPKGRREAADAALKTTATEKAKLDIKRPEARRAIDVAKLTINKMKTSAQELKTAPGIERIFGKTGMFPSVPGSNAANAQAKLNVLKNQVFASALQALRDASKTGGAVGQVSNIEGVRFENMFAALEKSQSVEQFMTELDKIIAHVDSVSTLLENEYAGQYGRRTGDKAGGGAGGDDPLGLRK